MFPFLFWSILDRDDHTCFPFHQTNRWWKRNKLEQYKQSKTMLITGLHNALDMHADHIDWNENKFINFMYHINKKWRKEIKASLGHKEFNSCMPIGRMRKTPCESKPNTKEFNPCQTASWGKSLVQGNYAMPTTCLTRTCLLIEYRETLLFPVSGSPVFCVKIANSWYNVLY